MSMATAPHPLRTSLRTVVADYVTLTKPRIMLLILITAYGAMAFAADGLPEARLTAVDAGRAGALVGRRQRAEPRARPRHRRPHAAHRDAAGGRAGASRRTSRAGSASASMVASAPCCCDLRQRARRPLWRWRRPVLRGRLHLVAEAANGAEHRDRRRCRRDPAAGRVGGGDRRGRAAGAVHVRDRVLLDAAALLGAGDAAKDDYAEAGVPMLPVVRGERGDGAADRCCTRCCWSA